MKKFFLFAFCLGSLLCACNTLEPETIRNDSPDVSFKLGGVKPVILTKATEIDADYLTGYGFNVSATTGSLGNEQEIWTNVQFVQSGDLFVGGQYWPSNNNNPYHFYASNAQLTFSNSGAVISDIFSDDDIICAYLPVPVYKAKNLLSFEHIFGVVGAVEIEALDGFDILDANIEFTPYIGGDYNIAQGYGYIDGTGWSNLVSGYSEMIADGVGITQNNLWIVPGRYTLSVSWTAMKENYCQDFVKEVDVNIQAGAINTIHLGLRGDADEIAFRIDVQEIGNNPIDLGDILAHDIPVPSVFPSFGGLQIAPAPLYYNGESFEIKDDNWEHESFGVAFGKTSGSYMFSFVDVGSYFDSRGIDFDKNSGDIDNSNTISYGDYEDWRLPTYDDFYSLIYGSRPGSTVNGAEGKRYACVTVMNLPFSYCTREQTGGIIFFPDNSTVTLMRQGEPFLPGYMDSGFSTTYDHRINYSELQDCLEQGCVFLPAHGVYYDNNWVFAEAYGNNNTFRGKYLTATTDDSTYYYCKYLRIAEDWSSPLIPSTNKSSQYGMVRLVRTI